MVSFLIFSILCTGCRKTLTPIEIAKKYGYWYGVDGITWGMTIEECKSQLKLNEDDYKQAKIDELKYKDVSEVETVVFNTNLYGTSVQVALYFIDFAPMTVNSEWLYQVQIHISDLQALTYEDTIKAIDAELEKAELSYQKSGSDRVCSTSISTLEESAIREKAVALLKECFDGLPSDEIERKINAPLDSITILGSETTSFRPISHNGMNAAFVALAEQGRGI